MGKEEKRGAGEGTPWEDNTTRHHVWKQIMGSGSPRSRQEGDRAWKERQRPVRKELPRSISARWISALGAVGAIHVFLRRDVT